MPRVRHFVSITVLLILSSVILIWLASNYYVSPLTVSVLIIACVVDLGLVYAYQRRIKTQTERNTTKGKVVDVSGMLLFLACNPILLILGVPTSHLTVGLFVMILSLLTFGLLGRLLSDDSKDEKDNLP